MTADLSFTIEVKPDVLCVPNLALQYVPTDPKRVREEDRELVTGKSDSEDDEKEEEDAEKTDSQKDRTRHVWVEGDEEAPGLRAIAVTTGVSDNSYTEIRSGDLEAGAKIVIGRATK